MATKLYLHTAANAQSGTFPTTIDGDPGVGLNGVKATGANTLRTMDTSIGVSQTSTTVTSGASTSPQGLAWAMFCSPPLSGDQTVGGGTITVNHANAESNTNMNLDVTLADNQGVQMRVIVWRPSGGGSVVGVVRDDNGTVATGPLEPTSASSEQVSHGTIASSAVSALSGDVIIFALGHNIDQGMATSYTGTFYYDGTTENTTENAVVSNHASFVQFAETLTFSSNKEIVADAAAYTYTATAADLEFDRQVVADAASYTYTASDATLQKGLTLAADAAAYAYTANDATLEFDRQIVADAASYLWTATDAGIELGLQVVADSAAYIWTAEDADMIYAGGAMPVADAIRSISPGAGGRRDWKALADAEYLIHKIGTAIPKAYAQRLDEAKETASEQTFDEPPEWLQEFIEEDEFDWQTHLAATDLILSRVDQQLQELTRAWLARQLMERMREEDEEDVAMLLLH